MLIIFELFDTKKILFIEIKIEYHRIQEKAHI